MALATILQMTNIDQINIHFCGYIFAYALNYTIEKSVIMKEVCELIFTIYETASKPLLKRESRSDTWKNELVKANRFISFIMIH